MASRMPAVGRVTVSLRRSTRAEVVVLFMSVVFQEIFQHGMTMLRENRFGVKLNPFNGQTFVAHAHDFSIIGPSGNFQIGWATCTLNANEWYRLTVNFSGKFRNTPCCVV
jgi:hypothetical protein